jgi:hypothetical protein
MLKQKRDHSCLVQGFSLELFVWVETLRLSDLTGSWDQGDSISPDLRGSMAHCCCCCCVFGEICGLKKCLQQCEKDILEASGSLIDLNLAGANWKNGFKEKHSEANKAGA